MRTHRNEHTFSVLREGDVACPVSAAPQFAASRQVSKLFRRTGRLQITVLVGKAHHGVGVADVDPLGIRAKRIEGDTEGLAQVVGEGRDFLRFAVGIHAAEDHDLV